MLPALPQCLNQAPPRAQQLTRPDFANVPHFGQIRALVIVAVEDEGLTDVAIGVRAIMSSRSEIGRRVSWRCVACVEAGVEACVEAGVEPCVAVCVEADVHTADAIDPDVPANINFLLASE